MCPSRILVSEDRTGELMYIMSRQISFLRTKQAWRMILVVVLTMTLSGCNQFAQMLLQPYQNAASWIEWRQSGSSLAFDEWKHVIESGEYPSTSLDIPQGSLGEDSQGEQMVEDSFGLNLGDLKPVSFVNYGEFDAVVMPYTFTPLGASSQAPAVHTSTVSTANDGVGDWPNTSRYLSVPQGTYSWCIDWEEGDLDEDGEIDYFHYIQNDPTLLDENDSDELEFAEEVPISAPPSSGEVFEGRCQPVTVETACNGSGPQVNVQAIYALEQEGKVEIYAVPNTAEKNPPKGIDLSHGGNSTGWGKNIILWSEGDFSQAATSNPYTVFGVQIHGDQTIGWARVLLDGQEIWRGDASRYSIAEGRYGVYVEVNCVPVGTHVIRVEGLGIHGSGGGSSIPVSYFGFGK
jgi:hypothetical protein